MVNGAQDVKYGDFIYVPKIKLSKTKVYPITYLVKNNKTPNIENPSYFFDSDVIKIEVIVNIYNGLSNEK